MDFTAEAIDQTLDLVLSRGLFPQCSARYVTAESLKERRVERQQRECYREPGHTEGGCLGATVVHVDQPSPWAPFPDAIEVIQAKWRRREARLAELVAEDRAEDERRAKAYAAEEAREAAAHAERWRQAGEARRVTVDQRRGARR